jgi:DNA repair protein RadA/Sms
MLAAVLQRARMDLFRGAEVFLNVPGGMRALDGGRGDPGCDLAVIASLLSSATGVSLPASALFLGEVSLTGELRRGVPRLSARLTAAAKAGYDTVYLPAIAMPSATGLECGLGTGRDWTLVPVRTVEELANLLDPDWVGPDAFELQH